MAGAGRHGDVRGFRNARIGGYSEPANRRVSGDANGQVCARDRQDRGVDAVRIIPNLANAIMRMGRMLPIGCGSGGSGPGPGPGGVFVSGVFEEGVYE